MGLVVTYFSPTTPGVSGWSEDLSDYVRLGTIAGVIDEAQLGAVGVSSIMFDDVNGDIGHGSVGIVGLKQMYLDETAAPPGDQRLWTGYIGDRTYRRGTDSLIVGVARKIDTTLIDINSFLAFRIFAPVALDPTSSFVRPAETDLQRITALLAVDFLSDTLYDEGLVATSGGVAMDKCDYTGQHPGDVLNDCSQQSGRNHFVTYNEATGHYQLFYHFNSDPIFDSPLQISNVLADVDNVTTFAPEPDAQLVRNPDRVVSAVYLPFNGSNSPAYRTRPANASNYAWRDASAPSSNVKTLAKANARADRYLTENSSEDDRITCTIKLPAQYVTQIKVGQRVQCKFSHLPNGSNGTWGSSFAWCRVLNRNVMANEMTNALYNMRLELTPLTSPGFAQLVLTTNSGDHVTTNGTYTGQWNGGSGGGITLPTPAIVQDTVGFTGTPGDMQWGVPNVTSWTIPPGYGGTYSVGWEQIYVNTAWWIVVSPPLPNPQQVPYVYGSVDSGCGTEIAGDATITFSLCANGTPVASVTITHSGGLGYWPTNVHLGPTNVVVADGDVMTFTLTFAGENYFETIYDDLGGIVYGSQQGLLVMTFLHP